MLLLFKMVTLEMAFSTKFVSGGRQTQTQAKLTNQAKFGVEAPVA